MADSKLSALTAATTFAGDELLYLVDDPAGTPVERKATIDDVLKTGARTPTATRRTSGNLTLNSTTWANVDTGLDITLSDLAADDWVELWLHAVVHPQSGTQWQFFDIATIVSAAVVNTVSTDGAESATSEGVSGWYITNVPTNVYITASGSVLYKVKAGDLSSGSVTFRLRYRQSAAANRTVTATASTPLIFQARRVA